MLPGEEEGLLKAQKYALAKLDEAEAELERYLATPFASPFGKAKREDEIAKRHHVCVRLGVLNIRKGDTHVPTTDHTAIDPGTSGSPAPVV
jgi:hypothetical protein